MNEREATEARYQGQFHVDYSGVVRSRSLARGVVFEDGELAGKCFDDLFNPYEESDVYYQVRLTMEVVPLTPEEAAAFAG